MHYTDHFHTGFFQHLDKRKMEARRKLTELAVRQASRKRRIIADKTRRRDNHRHIEESAIQRREDLDTIIAARKRQREDHALGPLKPWRELVGLRSHSTQTDPTTGEAAHSREANTEWGTYSLQKIRKPHLPEHMQLVRRKLILREGDRVAVKDRAKGVKEQSWGKIGTIKKIECDTGHVTITGVNMVCFSDASAYSCVIPLKCLPDRSRSPRSLPPTRRRPHQISRRTSPLLRPRTDLPPALRQTYPRPRPRNEPDNN